MGKEGKGMKESNERGGREGKKAIERKEVTKQNVKQEGKVNEK